VHVRLQMGRGALRVYSHWWDLKENKLV